MEGKTGRTKGKENTCRTVGITKALADSGHSTARKGFFYFFALKFGYSTETKNPNASPIRKVFGLFVCGRSGRIRTDGIEVPNFARYQLRHTPIFRLFYCTTDCRLCQYPFCGRIHLRRLYPPFSGKFTKSALQSDGEIWYHKMNVYVFSGAVQWSNFFW